MFFIGREGLIGGETCPREGECRGDPPGSIEVMVGQGILANHYVRTAWAGRPYGVVMYANVFWLSEGLIHDESSPREGM